MLITGYNAANDAHVAIELLRRAGTTDTLLAEADGPPPPAGMGLRTWIDSTVCANTGAAAGDTLVLRVRFLSGSSFFTSILTDLKIP